jgi:hypothetical protein
MNPEFHVGSEDEKNRYLEHNNDVYDAGYQNFVLPLVEYVLANLKPTEKVLDFGSGTAPVISHLLQNKGFQPFQYDIYFAPSDENLQQKYKAITACEVIEHFKYPYESYNLLFNLLENDGFLILKTSLYDEGIDFAKWRYRRDPTHTFIHHQQTLKVIEKMWDWELLEVCKDKIVFKKAPPST